MVALVFRKKCRQKFIYVFSQLRDQNAIALAALQRQEIVVSNGVKTVWTNIPQN